MVGRRAPQAERCFINCVDCALRTARHGCSSRTASNYVLSALQYLPHADNILWMEDGAVKGQGTYSQLVEQGEGEGRGSRGRGRGAAKVDPGVIFEF